MDADLPFSSAGYLLATEFLSPEAGSRENLLLHAFLALLGLLNVHI